LCDEVINTGNLLDPVHSSASIYTNWWLWT